MGFGPSASGKTFLTKLMIKLLLDIEGVKRFPNTFVSIDGGIIREVSFIYQFIIQNIKLHGKTVMGFSNLVSATGGESLFNSNIHKENLIKMLSNESNKYKDKISVYIPDTISNPKNCTPLGTCDILRDGIKITGDKDSWIGLLIWQHTLTAKCNKNEGYQCKGTIASGTARQIDEGKKYSSGAWGLSMLNGRRMLDKAPSYRFAIHNTGGLSGQKTILKDTTDYVKNAELSKDNIKNYFKSESQSQQQQYKFKREITNNIVYCYNQECNKFNKYEKFIRIKNTAINALQSLRNKLTRKKRQQIVDLQTKLTQTRMSNLAKAVGNTGNENN